MFIYLSKLLPPLIYPLGLTCILIVAGLLAARRLRLQRGLLLAALLLLWLSSTRVVAYPLIYALESQYRTPAELVSPPPDGYAEPIADVILVLGGGTDPQRSPRQLPEVNEGGDRLIYAAYLYQQGAAPKILLSGGGIDWLDSQSSPAQDMTRLLGLMGVPAEDIWIEAQSLNTYENALYSQPILEQHAARKIILVTSATHMPRSVLIFQNLGIPVIPAPADFLLADADMELLRSLNLATVLVNWLPDAQNLSALTVALKETMGILIYRLQGWL